MKRMRCRALASGSFDLLLAGMLCLVTSCAYQALAQKPGLVLSMDLAASAPAIKPDVSLTLYTRFLSFGSPLGPSMEKWWAKQQTHLRSRVDVIARQTPWLASARWDDPKAAYRLVLETTFDTRGNKARYMLTDFSKYLIPSSDEGVVSVTARVSHGPTELHAYEAEGTYRTRRHILFLLLPMLRHGQVPGKVAEDTIKDVLLEIANNAPTLFAAP